MPVRVSASAWERKDEASPEVPVLAVRLSDPIKQPVTKKEGTSKRKFFDRRQSDLILNTKELLQTEHP